MASVRWVHERLRVSIENGKSANRPCDLDFRYADPKSTVSPFLKRNPESYSNWVLRMERGGTLIRF
jgi:hypothetical protein